MKSMFKTKTLKYKMSKSTFITLHFPFKGCDGVWITYVRSRTIRLVLKLRWKQVFKCLWMYWVCLSRFRSRKSCTGGFFEKRQGAGPKSDRIDSKIDPLLTKAKLLGLLWFLRVKMLYSSSERGVRKMWQKQPCRHQGEEGRGRNFYK